MRKFRETVQYHDLHQSEIDFKYNRQPPGKSFKLGQILAVQLKLLIISCKINYVIKIFKLCKQYWMNRSGVVQFMKSSQLRENQKKKWSVLKWSCNTFSFYPGRCSRSPVSVNTGSFSGKRPSAFSKFISCVWIRYDRNINVNSY